MARKSGSRSRWLKKASEAAVLAWVLAAMPAQASDDAASDETARIIDRSTIASSFAAERPGAAAIRGVPLILAVQVNGMDHGLAQFRMIEESLWAAPSVLVDLGLRIDALDQGAEEGALLNVDQALGGGVSYDAALQSLSILVEVSKLAVGTSRLNLDPQDQPVAESGTGALLNYDAYASVSGSDVSLDGFTELRLFSGNVLLENTALFRLGGNRTQQEDAVRLDTSLAWSIPEKRLTLRAGDILTRSTSWSRPTRIGGFRIGTDFSLQPYLVTAPIPTFFGEATLPSTIDLYIDGMKRFSGEVAPGPFELGSGANRINGAGDAQVVVTDALGQVTTIDYPIYDTPVLLRQGLTDWSVEVGAVRDEYGIKSFDYLSDPVASASFRRGLSDTLTLEAHAELGPSLFNGGAGVAMVAPFGGVVSGSVAASHSSDETGYRAEVGYSWTNSTFNLSATLQRASDDYADIASTSGARVPVVRDLVSVGFNARKFGTFGASLVRQRYTDEDPRSYASANWHRAIGQNFVVSMSANQDLEDTSQRSMFLTFSFTPRQRDQVTASLQASETRTSVSAGYRRSVPYGGGTGWAVDTSYDGDRLQAAAQLDHLGRFGQVTAGGRLNGGSASAYAGYSGSLVMMGEGVFASRKVFDGFAVVSTSGVADVPVMLQNRAVGTTNDDGHLLVTGLNAYQDNRVSIDPTDLPATLHIGSVDAEAIPSRGSGVLVEFEIAPRRSVLVTVLDADGEQLPVGTIALMDGSDQERLMIGFDGQLYIDQAKEGARIVVNHKAGACGFSLPAQLPSDNAGILGTMICEAL